MFGLVAGEFVGPHLRISKLTARPVEILPGLRVPLRPFIGTMGRPFHCAPKQAGRQYGYPPGARLYGFRKRRIGTSRCI